MVASLDAADRMSKWSQSFSLAMLGLLSDCNRKTVNEKFAVLPWTYSTSTSGHCYSYKHILSQMNYQKLW